MSAERDQGDYPLKAPAHGGNRLFAPGWYLKLRLRWANARIAVLERELAGQFAVLETTPIHQELASMREERDDLQRRLAERA